MNKKNWIIRNYRPPDFDYYVRLHRLTTRQEETRENVSAQLLAEALGHPSFSPEIDLLVAEENLHKQLIGYVSVFREPGIGRALLNGLVHPANRRTGVGTDLFEHAVEHARLAGLSSVQICVSETNLPAKNLLTALGLKFFRHFWGFTLNLDKIRLPDVKVGQFTFRNLRPEETDDLTTIQNRSFADTWGFNPNTSEEISYRINSISCSPENVIMVYLGTKPVAYCWTRIHPGGIPNGRDKGEIHMLGVDPDFRRQSLGREVLTAGLSYLKKKGVEIVELMADGEMPAALALYESAGFKKYIRTEWYEMKL
jgi:mycothiol synthase